MTKVVAILVAAALTGCSSDPPTTVLVYVAGDAATSDADADAPRDSATPPVDTSAPADTAPAPDTATPDLDTAASDTAPIDADCSPASKASVCLAPAGVPACGARPDGCGGTVACDVCPGARTCILSGGEAVCGCRHFPYYSPCSTTSGAAGDSYDCAASVSPVDPDCRSIDPSRDAGSGDRGWCCVRGS